MIQPKKILNLRNINKVLTSSKGILNVILKYYF